MSGRSLHNIVEVGGNPSVGLLMAWEKNPIFTRFLKLVFAITVERSGIAGFSKREFLLPTTRSISRVILVGMEQHVIFLWWT